MSVISLVKKVRTWPFELALIRAALEQRVFLGQDELYDGLWDGVKGESMTRSVQHAMRWLIFNLQVRIRYTGEEYREWFRSYFDS